MEEIKLSIIIPAHNASATLERLVKSLFPFPPKGLEILVIENGSKDATTKTAVKLSNKFSCVKLYHSEKGVSNARNEGLIHARGKWIAFADADDWFLPHALSLMYSQAESDFVLYGFEAGEQKRSVAEHGGAMFKGKDCVSARIRMLENPTLYMTVWSKLFSGEIIRKHQLRFNPELKFSEDSDFTLRYTRYCSSIFFSDRMIYHYDLNNSSVMHVFDGKKAEEYLFAMRVAFASVQQETPTIQKAFEKYVLMHLNIVMVREVFSSANPKNNSGKMKQMRLFLNQEPFKTSLQNVKISECRSSRMLPILMLKLKCHSIAALAFRIKAEINRRREILAQEK